MRTAGEGTRIQVKPGLITRKHFMAFHIAGCKRIDIPLLSIAFILNYTLQVNRFNWASTS
jgi:hypothetical protein